MDAEVSAMNRIAKVLSELSEKDRAFVVRWFIDKYGVAPTVTPSSNTTWAPEKKS